MFYNSAVDGEFILWLRRRRGSFLNERLEDCVYDARVPGFCGGVIVG